MDPFDYEIVTLEAPTGLRLLWWSLLYDLYRLWRKMPHRAYKIRMKV